ncbi:MAG: PEP-CTERM sorting domain-containing protein [Isosphaeraceae bacterium]
MRKSPTPFLLLFCTIAALGPASARAGFTPLYSNITTFSGLGYAAGGATTVNGDLTTAMIFDDITAGPGLGGHSVDQLSFDVENFNSSSVFAQAIVQIYQSNGPDGGPGSLITSMTQTLFLTADSDQVETITSPSMFTMPTGVFWAGIAFDNTFNEEGAAQLNALGQGIFGPPTVGSSQDVFFQSSSATSIGTNNPAGTLFFFGGSPPADFGWSFATAQSVPEPSSLALSAIGGLVLVGVRLTRRRRSALTA